MEYQRGDRNGGKGIPSSTVCPLSGSFKWKRKTKTKIKIQEEVEGASGSDMAARLNRLEN
jgi:hypothetical protein